MAKERLVYGDFRPLRKGEEGYSSTARKYISPSSGEIIGVRQFQKGAYQGHGYEQRKAAEKRGEAPIKPTTAPARPKVTAAKGKKGYGQYIKHQRNDKGEIVRTRVNAKSVSSLKKQVDRIPSGQGVILHFVDSRTGKTVKAVGHGKNHTAKIDDLRRWADDAQSNGMDWDDAFWGAISETFDLYDEDGNAIAFAPSEFTNIIMYSEAA